MSEGLYDGDGLDGPFARRMRRAMKEDEMARQKAFERRRRRESLEKLHAPETADNMEVRLTLVRRIKAGELTLEQAQAELRRIKSAGRAAGKPVWGGRG